MPSDPHERAQFLISEALAGDLPPEDLEWLCDHNSTCRQCAMTAAAMSQVIGGLNSISFGIDPEMSSRIQRALAARARRRALIRRWPIAAVATAAVLLLLATVPTYHIAQLTRQTVADALLLEGVESRVSRTVPESMECLMGPQTGEYR